MSEGLKGVGNTLLYSSTESNIKVGLCAGALTASVYLGSALFDLPNYSSYAALATEALILRGLIPFYLRQRSLSPYLMVYKNKLAAPKVLNDGTRIGLDSWTGELHTIGFSKLWKLRFSESRVKRSLIVMSGVIEGLVNLAERVEEDPWYGEIDAFYGTSYIMNPRIGERLGFEVQRDSGLYGTKLSKYAMAFNRLVMGLPLQASNQEISTGWISTEKLLENKDLLQDELDRINKAIQRRS